MSLHITQHIHNAAHSTVHRHTHLLTNHTIHIKHTALTTFTIPTCSHTAHIPHAHTFTYFTHIPYTPFTPHPQYSLTLLEICMAHYIVLGKICAMCPVISAADQLPLLWGGPGVHWLWMKCSVSLEFPSSLLIPSPTVASNDTLRAHGLAQVMSLSPGHTWEPTGQQPYLTTQCPHTLDLWESSTPHPHILSFCLSGSGNSHPRILHQVLPFLPCAWLQLQLPTIQNWGGEVKHGVGLQAHRPSPLDTLTSTYSA